MAKQIYIDSQGNEHEISGTINTADMLPLSASDSQSTKEKLDENTTAINEVDTSLSNKADKTLTGFNLTAGTGMTLQYVNCFAFGNLKVISANIVVGAGATNSIATVPSAYSASNTTFFYIGRNGGNGAYGYITGTSLKTDSALPTGNYTINFVYR